MGGMVRQREFIFYDSGDHRASPDTGAKAISHRAGLKNVGQLLALAFRNSRRPAGAVSFQDSLHPINLPTLQPQANVRAMNFKDISNFGSGSALHIESHGVKSVGHPIGTFAQGLLAELNQMLDSLGSSTDLHRSHATSWLSSDMLHDVVLFMQSYIKGLKPGDRVRFTIDTDSRVIRKIEKLRN
jgi:hypothetical protein